MKKMPLHPNDGQQRPSPRPGYPQRSVPQADVPRRGQAPASPDAAARQELWQREGAQQAARMVRRPHSASAPPAQALKKRSFLPLLLTLLVLVALLLGAAYLFLNKNRGDGGRTVEALELRERTNRFRSAGNELSHSLVQLFDGLKSFRAAFTGSDQIAFLPELPESPFISMQEDWNYVEEQHVMTMGRVVIPRLGTNAPLADECTEQSLYWGFGRVPFWDDFGDFGSGGMVSLYGHRILSKSTGMYHAEDLKVGDVFWVDDFRSGKRYIYKIELIDHVSEEDHINYNMAVVEGEQPIKGDPSCMLVVCDPLIYGSSEKRYDSYGRLTHTLNVPRDDAYYQRYLSEHPEVVPPELPDGTASETAESSAESNP